MSKFIVFCAITTSILLAKQPLETFPFLGFTISPDKIGINSSVNNSTSKETNFGIRYGKQTLDWRTMFTLSANNNLQNFSLEIDKILMDDMFGFPEVRPYLGATVGFLHFEDDFSDDKNGLTYGGNFGFLLYVTDNIDADISYHYFNVQEIEPLRTMQGASFGIHYFY